MLASLRTVPRLARRTSGSTYRTLCPVNMNPEDRLFILVMYRGIARTQSKSGLSVVFSAFETNVAVNTCGLGLYKVSTSRFCCFLYILLTHSLRLSA